ncbi:MAG: M43 family zinc metalloprotease [Bacteroidota bacterium]
MWGKVFLSAFLLLAFQMVNAQHTEPCASHLYLQQLDAAYPGFHDATLAPFSRVRGQGQGRDLTLLTIPVVVHIVYQNESQNLPDETINEVIDVLNEDYRRLNTDADQIRDEFLDVVDDAFIEFELVGVERVETSATFALDIFGGGLPDNVKQAANGGSDAWDTERHLNIWVCNIEGGALLGYAYPPADLLNWPADANAPSPELDGVVIHYEVFRRTGDFTSTGLLGGEAITVPVRGRTVTHEVGHYLGLRHIWGDGTLAVLGIPDCDADDGVEDTPNQGLSSQFVCDPTANGCNEGAGDQPDMWENFMDYSQETCQNSFTAGQIEIMRSVLDNERSGLIEEVVSTQDIANHTGFSIYPNPTSDRLLLERNTKNLSTTTIRLVNAQGQLMQTWSSWTSERRELLLRDFPAGLYYVQLLNAKGMSSQAVMVN